jgi:hypothetical protein
MRRRQRSSGNRFKRLEYTVTRVSDDEAAFQAGTQTNNIILPQSLDVLLSLCDGIRPLSEHARVAAQQLPRRAGNQRELLGALRWLADRGFLVSERALLSALVARRSPARTGDAGGIRFVGIPTADRPHLLRRALRSYLANSLRHDRKPFFLVVDDSRTREALAANRAFVSTFARGQAQALYVGPEERAYLGRRLADLTGMPPAHVDWALSPSRRYPVTTGGARNALLLLAAGHLSLQIDDDTTADVFLPHGADNDDVIACSSAPDPTEFHFSNRPLEKHRPVDADVLELHERLLGRTISECVTDDSFRRCMVEAIGATFLETLASHDTIRTTTLGVAGRGTGSAAALLLGVPNQSRERLLATESGYRAAMAGEHVRCVQRHTISDSRLCIGLNLALDTRSLLPPFFPVLRDQDAVFGMLLQRMGAYKGFIPRAVRHGTGDRTPLDTPSIAGRGAGSHAASHVIRLLEKAPAVSSGLAPDTSLSVLGAHLSQHAARPAVLEHTLAPITRFATAQRLRWANWLRCQSLNRPTPQYRQYRQHLDQIIHALRRDLESEPAIQAVDLRGPSFRTPLQELCTLMGAFGGVLRDWPAMFAAAMRTPLVTEIAHRQHRSRSPR